MKNNPTNHLVGKKKKKKRKKRKDPSCLPDGSLAGSQGGRAITSEYAVKCRAHPWSFTESQNDRMFWVGRDLCGSSSPIPLPRQGHLEQAAQDLVHAGLEYLQRRRIRSLPGQSAPVLCHPQSEVLPQGIRIPFLTPSCINAVWKTTQHLAACMSMLMRQREWKAADVPFLIWDCLLENPDGGCICFKC